MGWHEKLWELLGGAVDETGEPVLGPDDMVAVFEGVPGEARIANEALAAEGFHAEYQEFLVPRGRLSIRLARVSVPAPDAAAADAVVAELDWLEDQLHPERTRMPPPLPDDAESIRYDRQRRKDGTAEPVVRFGWLGWRCIQFVLLVWLVVFVPVALVGIIDLALGWVVVSLVAVVAGAWALRASQRKVRSLG